MTMKRLSTVVILLFALIPPPLQAQTDVDLSPDFGGRLSLSVDKKLARGLHLNLEEEVRLDNNFQSLNRLQTTLALSYKVNDYLKVGLGYALINPYSQSNSTFKSCRHRLMVDATGSVSFGNWRFSLKERFQATYRSGEMNTYQNPRTALTLKSRLKATYKGLQRWEPYAYIELRNTFNAPVINAYYTGSEYVNSDMSASGPAGWFIDDWNGIYINHIRGAIGVDYRISKRSSIEMSLMADHVTDKVVDANAEGTKLKSYTRESGFVGWLTAGYSYKF